MLLNKMAKIVGRKMRDQFTSRVQPNAEIMTVSFEFMDIVSEFEDMFVDELPDELLPKRQNECEL